MLEKASDEGDSNLSQKIDRLPSAIQKRDLLFGVRTANAQEWKNGAQQFLAEDWVYDGIDFLTQAGDKAALESLFQKITSEGNTFLLQKIFRSMGIVELGDSDKQWLRKCSEVAEAQGKYRYAMKGFERLGETADVERIRAMVSQDGDIVTEAKSEVFIPPISEEDENEEGT